MSTDEDPLAEIRETFFVECEDLLENLQDGLQSFEDDQTDPETINVIFRAVHSIKGGAGAFGFNALVDFSHQFETILDQVRTGLIKIDTDTLSMLFTASDVLGDLVRAEQSGISVASETIENVTKSLASIAVGPIEVEEVDLDFVPMTISLDEGPNEATDVPTNASQTLCFKPHSDFYASGNEPLFILSALEKLGRTRTKLDFHNVPPLAEWSEDGATLAWQIEFENPVERDLIDEVFEFVSDVCDLSISREDPDLSNIDIALPGLIQTSIAPNVKPPVPAEAQSKPSKSSPDNATIRVSLAKIDRLMNLVTELVINQAMLNECVSGLSRSNNSQVERSLDELNRLSRDLQDGVMGIRAQPVKPLFQRMGRIVREASADLGKPVKFSTNGEETEVDRTVLERLVSPLTHMLRNAIDHGLESRSKRSELGKPPEGSVTLTAAHKAGRVVISVFDDGAGLDRDKIRKKATQNGLIAPGTPLTDSEIDALLFLPGFSTADEVSALSGRGVGMDVVKTSIEELGGRITISSKPGCGTSFLISLPLTLAVLDGMIVRIAGETMVMPLSTISETLLVDSGNLRQVSPQNLGIDLRGSIIPLIDLGVALGLRAEKESYIDTIVLIIESDNGNHFAMVVDEILEQRQVVIKGLGTKVSHIPGVAAATILGDGHIALILDPPGISQGTNAESAKHGNLLEMAP